MSDLYGFLFSFLIIAGSILTATLYTKLKGGESELSRKIIHILVGNWVLITPFFTNYLTLVFVPLLFIVVNYLSTKHKIIKAMEREEGGFGTVYYAISLFILCSISYVLNWKILAFSGILIMTYSDGLAAIIGMKYGNYKPFKFALNKSFAGSITVFGVTWIISFLCLTFFKDFFEIHFIGYGYSILLSTATAFLTTYVELVGDDGGDNLTVPLSSGIFLSLQVYLGSLELNLYLLLAIIILALAVYKKSISLNGSITAFLTAIVLYSFGGFWVGISLIIFFILGSIVSRIKNNYKENAELRQENLHNRGWKQVLANSFPACVLVFLYFIFPKEEYLPLIAISVFSAASADTFSSELGMMSKGKVYDILTFKEIPAGLSGGVSILGFLFGVIGSISISSLAIIPFGKSGFLISTFLGILGTVADSILGSALQRKYYNEKGDVVEYSTNDKNRLSKGFVMVSNNTVNMLSLILVSIAGVLIYKLGILI